MTNLSWKERNKKYQRSSWEINSSEEQEKYESKLMSFLLQSKIRKSNLVVALLWKLWEETEKQGMEKKGEAENEEYLQTIKQKLEPENFCVSKRN